MPTNAELASELLHSAADFFREVGSQNLDLKAQMTENAKTFDTVADLVKKDPQGEMPDNV